MDGGHGQDLVGQPAADQAAQRLAEQLAFDVPEARYRPR